MKFHAARLLVLCILALCCSTPLVARKKKAAPLPCTTFRYTPNITTSRTSYKVLSAKEETHRLTLELEDCFSDNIIREDMLPAMYDSLRAQLPAKYKDYQLQIRSHGEPIEAYVANVYRRSLPQDRRRLMPMREPKALVTKLNAGYDLPLSGLANRHIVLWGSHGFYFNGTVGLWEWQRPRMFGTVEDLLTSAFVIPYLAPMLEAAGARVYMPRERDLNPNRLSFTCQKTDTSVIFTSNEAPAGTYRLKIWYPKQSGRHLLCRVEHAGVTDVYRVDAGRGYHTWLDIDKLYVKGICRLSFTDEKGRTVQVDSVRMGGGMSRTGSGLPCYAEAALYYLQQAGVPDSMIKNQKKGVISDYYDDIYGRSRWVNFLAGGSEVFPSHPGVGIPVDVSVALHSDAGTFGGDSLKGTTILCTSDTLYPSKYTRMAAHDLADILHTQLLSDLRAKYNPNWPTRGIWHRQYVETRVLSVPAVIIEMFAHQNFADMRYALQPQFRFDLARAVYKGILRYLAAQRGTDYVVQPLPVTDFAAVLHGDSVRLSWKRTEDPLEPTAIAQRYVVYTAVNGGAFDGGRVVSKQQCCLPLQVDSLYSFKVCAMNEGGLSFPSEVLSAGRSLRNLGQVLAVNCFDRVDGPTWFAGETEAGFLYEQDPGVPDRYDMAYLAPQIEFDRSKLYQGNDYPGFGACLVEDTVMIHGGNRWNYPEMHGKALLALGYSFSSCSRQALENHEVPLEPYQTLDMIFGKQRKVGRFDLFSVRMQDVIRTYLQTAGRKLILSGAYVGRESTLYTEKTLRYKIKQTHATTTGELFTTDGLRRFQLHLQADEQHYALQSVDALSPVYADTKVLLQYADTRLVAAQGQQRGTKIVVAGFPLECLQDDAQLREVMDLFMKY